MATSLDLVVFGSVEAGRSTLVERLFNAREAPETCVLNTLKAELELSFGYESPFEIMVTRKYKARLTDVPGHCHFMLNMVTRASAPDVCVAVVDGSHEDDLTTVTYDQVHLAYTLGVKRVIVAINKMDAPTINYQQLHFEKMKSVVEKRIEDIGFDDVYIIPTSGLCGDNVVIPGTVNMPWYSGPTLFQALQNVSQIFPIKTTLLPLRVSIEDVYKIAGIGTVPVGRIEAGVLKPGDRVTFAPGNIDTVVKSIEIDHGFEAYPGDRVGFCVKNVPVTSLHKGYVCGHTVPFPPRAVKSFTALIVVLMDPTQPRREIVEDFTAVIDCHYARFACTITRIVEKMDRRTGRVLQPPTVRPQRLRNGDAAVVVIKPLLKSVCVERYRDFPALGRFAIRSEVDGRTISIGVIQNVEHSV